MTKLKENVVKFHDKHYKTLLIIPLLLIILSLAYLGFSYSKTGEFFQKDITLTGGTSVTVFNETLDMNQIKSDLSGQLPDLTIRKISGLTTGEQKALEIKTTLDVGDTREILENYLGYKLTTENSSIFSEESSFSQSFFNQLMIAIVVAFVFMAIVIFIIFRDAFPSLAVVISAFADITMTLALVDLFGMKIGSAGIVAFLMLIGYSVDTDILLTTRMLKRREGSLNSRIWGSFKTGTTMTLTSFFAILIALIVVQSFSDVLTQIFTILVIGLGFDLLNTWITNVSLLKWYIQNKEKKQ